jgi:hypothetical protein
MQFCLVAERRSVESRMEKAGASYPAGNGSDERPRCKVEEANQPEGKKKKPSFFFGLLRPFTDLSIYIFRICDRQDEPETRLISAKTALHGLGWRLSPHSYRPESTLISLSNR